MIRIRLLGDDDKIVKKDQTVISKNDFGELVENYVRSLLRYNPYMATGPDGTDAKIREWWPKLDEYSRRHIQTAIEVAIEMDKHPPPPHSNRRALQNKELWIKFLADFRPPPSSHTIDYTCNKCKVNGVKLWRQYQTYASSVELLCAKCAAPGDEVDESGTIEREYGKTDQISSYLVPAVPVGDTFWGYTSVPSQDLEWWQKLPTYAKTSV